MINPQIFREYDIRGIVGKDLIPQVVREIGKAFGTYIHKEGRRIALGRDVRLSSKPFRDTLIEGLLSTGLKVIDVGVVPTPVLYYSILHYKTNGGVMITGSHNPIEFNGFKLCRKGAQSLYGEEIQKIRKILEKGDFLKGEGEISLETPVDDYKKMIKSKIKVNKKIKLVIDAGNGTGGMIAPSLFEEMGCEVIPLYCQPDGNFPHHLPDPTIPAYMVDLKNKVIEEKADVGFAFDGDSDRIGVVDDLGRTIWGDRLLALYAREVLRRGKFKIIFEVKSSQALIEDIRKHGGIPVMWKTGHSLIKEKMREEKAPLAGEVSGHMFFGDNYYGYDDAIYAAARLLQIMGNTDKKLSQLNEEVPNYPSTPEIRINCPDEEKFQVVEEIKRYFRDKYETIEVDGVRIVFPDGWALVRASNTQPVLVLRFEAKTPKRLEELQEIVRKKLQEFPSVDRNW